MDFKKVGLIVVLLFGPIIAFAFFVFVLMTIVLAVFVDVEMQENEMEGGVAFCSPSGEINKSKWDETYEKMNLLSGKGDKVIEVSKKQGVDPVLFTAIMIVETGWGSEYDSEGNKSILSRLNNPGGLRGSNGWMSFSSIDEGIESMGGTLHRRIIQDGLTSISDLGSHYAPLEASPKNKDWVPNVTSIVSNLGGLTMNCEKVIGDELMIVGDTAWPTMGANIITSGFGPRSCRGCSSNHKGIDIAAPGDSTGIGAVAFASGEVVNVESGCSVGDRSCGGGFGNFVLIDHGNGKSSLYAHLSQVNTRVGEKVKSGNLIGLIGRTGSSGRAHLHFEYRVNGIAVDPLFLFEDFDYIVQ